MNNAFLNDYNQLCSRQVYDFVGKHLYHREKGYEEDSFCREAENMIRKVFAAPDAMVQFFIGGTSTNLTMISHLLPRSYEAVIATKYSHIANHEGGAIEGTGHKVVIADDENGKILPESIEEIYLTHRDDDHMVIPKMVYISNTTEVGTVYTLAQLKAVSQVCKKYGLLLYVDGARLFAAHCSTYNDISYEDWAKYADVFYIGGTKNGLMLGEAAVIVNKGLQCHMMRHMKNRGAMLAKGSLIGLNFMALFTDNLYERLAENANSMAVRLAQFLESEGYEFQWRPESNQLFVNMDEDRVNRLAQQYDFADMGYADRDRGIKTIRLVTSFSTTLEDVNQICNYIKEM